MKNTHQEFKSPPFKAVDPVQALRSSLLEDKPRLLDEFDVRTINEAVKSVLDDELKREIAIKEKYFHYLLKKQDLMQALKDETFLETIMRKIELCKVVLKFNYEMFKIRAVNLFISLKYKILP